MMKLKLTNTKSYLKFNVWALFYLPFKAWIATSSNKYDYVYYYCDVVRAVRMWSADTKIYVINNQSLVLLI